MSFWDWLTGRDDPAPAVPDDEPYMTVDTADGPRVIDRETYEYRSRPDAVPGGPVRRRDLDRLLAGASRIRAVAGPTHRGRPIGFEVLVDEADPAALDGLRRALRIDPEQTGRSDGLGGLALVVDRADAPAATLSLHGGVALRWYGRWRDDAMLADARALRQWLVDHGAARSLLDRLERGSYPGVGPRYRGGRALTAAEQVARLAAVRSAEGDPRGALADLDRLIGAGGAPALAYGVRGWVRGFGLGDPRGADADAHEALAIDPGQADYYALRGTAREATGRPRDAVDDYGEALRLAPDQAGIWAQRAGLYLGLGLRASALADLDRSLELRPDFPATLWNRAEARREAGDLEGALADLDRLLARLDPRTDADPADAPPAPEPGPTADLAYIARARIRLQLGRHLEAEADLGRAERLQPAEGLSGRAALGAEHGDHDLAVAALDRLIRLRPGTATAHLNRAQSIELSGGDPGRAAADYDEAVRLAPDQPAVYHARAAHHARAGRFAEALDDLEAARRAAPGHPGPENSLAWFLATCPDADYRDGPRAVAMARGACQATDWRSAELIDTLAAACAEAGDFHGARRWSARAVELADEAARPRFAERQARYGDGRPWRQPSGPGEPPD